MAPKRVKELNRLLKNKLNELDVVVMPDFFLDRIVSFDENVETFSKAIREVANRKGGSVDGTRQTNLSGGNAVNTASALASLGSKVTPIICTDKLGSQLIRFYMRSGKVDLTHLKVLDKPSITTAIELRTKKGKVNIMLRDVGALANFGPKNLANRDYEVVARADYVCIFNWAGTRYFGTELAEVVFERVKTKGRGKTYIDTADPLPNGRKIRNLVDRVFRQSNLDILSVNENEAVCYAKHLSTEVEELQRRLSFEDLAKESARILASKMTARIDLHSTDFSASFRKENETIVPSFKVPVLRATGAGDAWNAGNILGDSQKLTDEDRLLFANAVAAYYISSARGAHPTQKQLSGFLGKLRIT